MDNTRLSVRLYKILDGVGASEKMRRLHRRLATTFSIQDSIHDSTLGFSRTYWCGSSYEGSITPDLRSDTDILDCYNTIVTTNPAALPPGISYLIVSDSWTYPGYAKLQYVVDGEPQFSTQVTIPTPIHEMRRDQDHTDNAGRLCKKHFSIKNRHGPAQMDFGLNGEHLFDSVHAFYCKDLMPSALEGMMRRRPYSWPSTDQLQAMSNMGCMLVSVGPKDTSEREPIEWRLSYTLQERLLMASLNHVQHKVYVLLKMINKDMLRPKFEDQGLTSYHLKTCILYAVEMTPAHVWAKDNLINCLFLCLKLMTKWLKINYCPSYFTNEANLFAKEGFEKCRLCLLMTIRQLIESKQQFLYELQSDNVGAILRNGDWGMYRDITVKKKNNYIFGLKLEELSNSHKFTIRTILKMKDGGYHPILILCAIQYCKNTIESNINCAEAMSHIMTWLNLYAAKSFASLAHQSNDAGIKQMLTTISRHLFHEAREADLVNERLAVASVLFTSEKYDTCLKVLQLLEEQFPFFVNILCPCGMHLKRKYYPLGEKRPAISYINKLSLKDYTTQLTACCVTFLPSAAAIAPEPLHHEMRRSLDTHPGSREEEEHFWFDWAVVDAKLYLYFLQYLVSEKLKMDGRRLEARLKMSDLISRGEIWLYHKETAYNLLGWIHMQEQRLAEAFLCFAESWKIRPHHNAAKFHMVDWLERVTGK